MSDWMIIWPEIKKWQHCLWELGYLYDCPDGRLSGQIIVRTDHFREKNLRDRQLSAQRIVRTDYCPNRQYPGWTIVLILDFPDRHLSGWTLAQCFQIFFLIIVKGTIYMCFVRNISLAFKKVKFFLAEYGNWLLFLPKNVRILGRKCPVS